MADASYQTKNYEEQGGARAVFNGRLAINDEDITTRVDFTIGAEAANVINVGMQLKADEDNETAADQVVRMFLSDDSGGAGITATAPDGGVAAGTDGNILLEDVANKMLTVQSEADGDIDIDITESGTATWYLVVIFADGRTAVSAAITFAA